jgi:hypothetical protein
MHETWIEENEWCRDWWNRTKMCEWGKTNMKFKFLWIDFLRDLSLSNRVFNSGWSDIWTKINDWLRAQQGL